MGGPYTSYNKDHYPINFNYTFRGLTDDLPLCFNFPGSHTSDLITPSKEGCIGASEKAILTDSPASKFSDKTGDWLVWILQACIPGVLDPYKSLFLNAPPKYPNCIDVAPSDVIWKTINNCLGYPVWKPCTYNSKIDYRIPGGGNYSVQDWSNPNPSQNPGSVSDHVSRFSNWKNDSLPWPLVASRWHYNQFVPPPCCPIQLRVKLFGNQKFGEPLLPLPLLFYLGQKMIPPILCWLVYPPLMFFLFTNDSKRLHIQMNYSGGPNIVCCKQCMLSSCLTPQYNICSFVVLQRPPYLMVPVAVNTYWYDNYGLAVLQQLQDLMHSQWFVGIIIIIIIIGISALITAITSVTVAAISLTQQVHTAQYVNDVSNNVSLALAMQEIIDRKLEVKIDALEEVVMHIGTELQALRVKLALSCHTDYPWICVTPLKVNDTDYNWEKIKNHISGVWNSSSISLDLGFPWSDKNLRTFPPGLYCCRSC